MQIGRLLYFGWNHPWYVLNGSLHDFKTELEKLLIKTSGKLVECTRNEKVFAMRQDSHGSHLLKYIPSERPSVSMDSLNVEEILRRFNGKKVRFGVNSWGFIIEVLEEKEAHLVYGSLGTINTITSETAHSKCNLGKSWRCVFLSDKGKEFRCHKFHDTGIDFLKKLLTATPSLERPRATFISDCIVSNKLMPAELAWCHS